MSQSAHHPITRKILKIIILTMLTMACGFAQATPTPEPSATPPQPSDTPEPTSTATEPPTATATEDLAATEFAQATADAEAFVQEEIAPILEDVGLSTDSGHLAWTQEGEVRVVARTYLEEKFEKYGDDNAYGDFVLFSNVEWDSTGGLAGCGLVFRSEEDLEEGSQYIFFAIRFSGIPAWEGYYYDKGEFVSSISGGSKVNGAINQGAGDTNAYIIVAEGDSITVYANGERLSAMNATKLDSGYFGVLNSQESGETTCIFQDGWIWSLDE